MKKFLLTIAAIASLVVLAANHRSSNLLNGQVGLFYQDTGSAKTLQFDDTYTTNVVITNFLGVATTPQATNSATGALVPSWSMDTQAWADSMGDIGSPNISVTVKGSATLTNTVTFVFARSADGTNFGYSAQDTFTFAVTPTTTAATTITNVPAVFVTGTKLIRPYRITLAAGTTAGVLTLSSMTLNGYVP